MRDRKLFFYKIAAISIIILAIVLSAAFGIILPFKTHPYFLTVAILYVTGTIILIAAALVCLFTLYKENKRLIVR